jgi:hypothetical protein
MANTLALYDAVGILDTLVTTTDDVARCDNCLELFAAGTPTYSICTAPTEGDADAKNNHKGHTACATCAKDPLSYIAEGGACRPCLEALGRRRSNVSRAGVALRPPVENYKVNRVLTSHWTAKRQIDEAIEAQDAERRQEGGVRRAAAVDDVRRRRTEEAEKAEVEAARVRAAAQAEAECVRAKCLEVEAETERKRQKVEAETERKRLEVEAETECKRLRAEAETERMREEAAVETERKREEADKNIDEQMNQLRDRAQKEADEYLQDMHTGLTPPGRKRRAQTDASKERRRIAMIASHAEKKRKLDEHAQFVRINALLEKKLATALDMARDWMKRAVEDDEDTASQMMEDIEARFAEMEEEEAEEEDEYVEPHGAALTVD